MLQAHAHCRTLVLLAFVAWSGLVGSNWGSRPASAMATRPQSTPGMGPASARPVAKPGAPLQPGASLRPGVTLQPGSGAATPTPSETVRPAGLSERAVFGTVVDLRLVDIEQTAIAVDGEDAAKMAFAASTNRYVTLDNGVEYAIHWEDARRFAKLKVGDTVNVYPTRDSACFERPGSRDCRVLMHVYVGKAFVPPLEIL